MRALILAAGYATRLWPLTLERPKPLLLIRERPIIEYIIEKLKDIDGLEDIFVVTNTKFVKAFKAWNKNYKNRFSISVIDDGIGALHKRRGSIGDIIFSIKEKDIKSDLLVIAGDNIFDFKVDDFIKQSRRNSPSATIGLFDIKNKTAAKRFGIAEIDANSKIVSFEEKSKEPKSTLAAMCLYYFPKEKLIFFKEYEGAGHSLDLAGVFISWLSKKEPVYGYRFEGRWLDIGDKESLKKSQQYSWA